MTISGYKNDNEFMVQRSDDTMVPFDPKWIKQALLKETKIATKLYGIDAISEDEAEFVVEESIIALKRIGQAQLTSSLIREVVNATLLKYQRINPKFPTYVNVLSKIGASFSDVWGTIWSNGKSFEKNENANQQQGNPEVIHKKLGDIVVKATVPLALPKPIQLAHYMGDIHLHQLEYPNRPFCSDYDMRYVYKNGLLCDGTGFYTATAGPAKHPEVAILHAVKVMAAGQCSCQGGQGLFNFNVFIAPYLKGLNYDQISQLAEMFLFETNETYVSRGGQLVFSSIQLEAGIPKIWQDAPVVMKGKVYRDQFYGDYEKEATLFARALLEKFIKGDKLGKMFFFPKPEIRLRKEYFENESHREILDLACELSSKFGSSYFDNLLPDYRDSDGQDCYQCCAYHFSEDKGTLAPKLNYEDGQHFSMGGQQVVTINLPRLAYLSRGNDERLFELLRDRMDLAKQYLIKKRKWMLEFSKGGNLAFLTQRPRSATHESTFVDLEEASSIIGFVGANDMAHYHTGKEMHESKDSHRFALRVLVEMEKIRKDFSIKHPEINFAIARTPAESTASRFAVLDLSHHENEAINIVRGDTCNWKERFFKHGRTGVPVYYTNGFMVRHGAEIELHDKIRIEEPSFPLLSGGNIMNIFLGEHAPDSEALLALTKHIASSNVGYWSYTTDLTLCKKCFKKSQGLKTVCPFCMTSSVEHYSRITGYYQAVSGWNAAKKQELKDRFRIAL